MRKILILFIAILWLFRLDAAFDHHIVSARSAGLGNSYSTIADTGDSVYYNPACIMNAEEIGLSFSYINLYQLGLIQYGYAGAVFPLEDFHGAGMGIKLYGTTEEVKTIEYNERETYIGYAVKWASFASSGITFRYLQAFYSGAGKGAGWGLDFGTLFWVDKMLSLSFVLENIKVPQIQWYTGAIDKKQRDIRLGAGLHIDNFLITTEISRIILNQTQLGLGIEYQIIDYVILRSGGFNQYGMRWTLVGGVTLKYGHNAFHYAYQVHYSLPGTHYLSIDFRL